MKTVASWFVFLVSWASVCVVAGSPIFMPILVGIQYGVANGATLAGGYLFVALFFGSLWVTLK